MAVSLGWMLVKFHQKSTANSKGLHLLKHPELPHFADASCASAHMKDWMAEKDKTGRLLSFLFNGRSVHKVEGQRSTGHDAHMKDWKAEKGKTGRLLSFLFNGRSVHKEEGRRSTGHKVQQQRSEDDNAKPLIKANLNCLRTSYGLSVKRRKIHERGVCPPASPPCPSRSYR